MNRTCLACFIPVLLFAVLPFAWATEKKQPPARPAVYQKLPQGYILDKVKGTVLVIPKGASKAVTAQEEQSLQEGDEIITKGSSEATLALNETTMFQITADSDLKVDHLALKPAGGFLSRLKLVAGKVFSQVERLGMANSTFEVEAGGTVCGVRGTAFETQKDGSLVQTNTFEGVVEMRKGDKAQQVAANYHAAFAGDKGVFLQQRVLTEREKARYQNWQRYSLLVTKSEHEREEDLKAFDSLPSDEKSDLWEKVQREPAGTRLKLLRQMLRERELQHRDQVSGQGVEDKDAAVKEREKARLERIQERQKSLGK